MQPNRQFVCIYNFIYGYSIKTDARFVFDCGIPRLFQIGLANTGKNNKKDEVDYDFIQRLRPNLIIISHWDEDHYSGIFSLPRCVWDNDEFCVVAPQEGIEKCESWKNDFLNYLYSRNALYLVEVDPKTSKDYDLFSVSKKKVLFQGKGTDKNSKSLLLRLNHTVLPGVCLDRYWPDKFACKDDIEHIVLPHHGARGVLNKSEIAKEIKRKLKYDMYICAGFNNSYGHPFLDWVIPASTDTSNCQITCTNIRNPMDSLNSWEPVDDNKSVITIYNA